MARVADFVLFQDKSFDLYRSFAGPEEKTLTRNIPDFVVSGEGALLTWNVRREGSGPPIEYEVFVNDSKIITYSVSLGDWSTVQESIPTGTIHIGENKVTFKVEDTNAIKTNRLSVGDVVLCYRQHLVTVPGN